MSANAFVKTELQRSEIEPMPPKDFFFVVYPCKSCGNQGKWGSKAWESCMRQRRHCLRRDEEHPLPTIERVPIDELDDSRDFACVFETDGSDKITWDKGTTRCRVPCDKCWSLGQCTRNNHCLDPYVIAFLDIDDAPGVTPAKRSCKNSSSGGGSSSRTGSAKTPGSEGRDAKQARRSPAASPSTRPGAAAAGSSSSSSPPATPSPAPRLPARPATVAAAATGPEASTRRSSSSTSGSTNGGGGGGGGGGSGISNFPSDSVAGAVAAAAGYIGKGKGRQQQAAGAGVGSGGSGSEPRSLSPDTGAGTGSGADASAGAGAGVRNQGSASPGGSEIYVQSLRGRMKLATEKVQKVAEHLIDLDKVKQHARAKIRDAERLLKSTEMEEQKHQKNLIHAQSEEAAIKKKLRDALKGSAERLKEDAARLEREAQLLR